MYLAVYWFLGHIEIKGLFSLLFGPEVHYDSGF